ncbi:MAG: HK97 family phage prohead protease [Beijerinckiaceae bacterium]
MTDQEVSIDEFMSRRKSSSRDAIIFKAVRSPASWNKQARSARFVMTTQSADRDGDIVFTDGIDLTEFTKNPVALLNHRSADLIGSWANVVKGSKKMEGDVVLAKEGTSPEVDKTEKLIDQGLLRAASIGFIPKTIKRIVMEDGTPTWSFEIVASELVECSVVTIPANSQALIKGAQGGEEIRLARDLIEEIFDVYMKDPATGLIIPKSEYEAARKALDGDKTFLTVKALDDIEPPKGFLKRITDAVISAFPNAQAEAALKAAEQQALADAEASAPKKLTDAEKDALRARSKAVRAKADAALAT